VKRRREAKKEKRDKQSTTREVLIEKAKTFTQRRRAAKVSQRENFQKINFVIARPWEDFACPLRLRVFA
jgi:hypothetical protein